MEQFPLTEKGLRQQTKRDPVLSKILENTRSGWPHAVETEELLAYYEIKDEISIEGEILMWQDRIIIPEKLRRQVLETLHLGHVSIPAMRSFARFHVWWPKIDTEIETFARTCQICQNCQDKSGQVPPLFSWNAAEEPWERVHIDYTGPFNGHVWFVMVDSYSRWVEIIPLKSATVNASINAMREMFGRYGICKQLVSDNRNVFTSKEFEKFCESNCVQHIKITPYHPQSNELAERMVQIFKKKMSAASKTSYDVLTRLHQFLMAYRNTPQAPMERTPAELFLGRRLPTLLDRIRPDPKRLLEKAMLKQRLSISRSPSLRRDSSSTPIDQAASTGENGSKFLAVPTVVVSDFGSGARAYGNDLTDEGEQGNEDGNGSGVNQEDDTADGRE